MTHPLIKFSGLALGIALVAGLMSAGPALIGAFLAPLRALPGDQSMLVLVVAVFVLAGVVR